MSEEYGNINYDKIKKVVIDFYNYFIDNVGKLDESIKPYNDKIIEMGIQSFDKASAKLGSSIVNELIKVYDDKKSLKDFNAQLENIKGSLPQIQKNVETLTQALMKKGANDPQRAQKTSEVCAKESLKKQRDATIEFVDNQAQNAKNTMVVSAPKMVTA